MKAAKRWGTTEVVVANSFCEVHRIVVRPRQKCSRHKHEYKNNAFYVEKGELIVWMQDGDAWAKVHLQQGDYLNVPPNIEHQFETWDIPCVAFEIYFPDGCVPDIVRQPSDTATRMRGIKITQDAIPLYIESLNKGWKGDME